MGKRKADIRNIENTSPESYQSSHVPSTKEMKTRSSKAAINRVSPSASPKTRSSGGGIAATAPESGDSGRSATKYPAAALIQEIATTIASDTEADGGCTPLSVVDTTAGDEAVVSCSNSRRSPLVETPCNMQQQQSPDRSAAAAESEYISSLVDLAVQSEATPTTNLKILCEAVDKDESVDVSSSSYDDKVLEVEVVDGADSSAATQTPSKPREPVTPTANLKMLITAASPEIRSLELSKSRLFAEDEEEMEDDDYSPGVGTSTGGSTQIVSARKQKSLGILCRRFMAQFDEFPPPTSRIEVSLDELASHLGTERRRIYDIVNVLESVEMMSRRAKNRYLWHGKTNLNATLVKLKYYAESERVAKQLELVRELELTRMYGRKTKSNGYLQSEEEAVRAHPKYKEYLELFGENHKRERSLGVMSQKFLMLFLTGRTKTINLDMAAKLLLGDPMVQTKQTNAQFKTKIRRLYDIANILASLNLICKVHVNELRGRKPAFSYIGPDVEQLATLDEYQYLKEVEVTRPGRTTLDMKMDELKRKMEAHIAAEREKEESGNQVKQVPPVTVPGPDLLRLKEDMNCTSTGGSGAGSSMSSLSHIAGEYVAKRRPEFKERPIKPKTASASAASASGASRQFVILQGAGTVITTSKAPQFMDGASAAAQTISAAPVMTSSGQEILTLLPLPCGSTVEGNQILLAAGSGVQQSSTAVAVSAGSAVFTTARLLGHQGGLGSVSNSPQPGSARGVKRSAAVLDSSNSGAVSLLSSSQISNNSSLLEESSEGSTFFITKSDNEYYIVNKRPSGGQLTGDQLTSPSLDVATSSDVVTVGGGEASQDGDALSIEVQVSDGQPVISTTADTMTPLILHTPVSGHLPVIYSTPHASTLQTPGSTALSTSTGQITILTSPIIHSPASAAAVMQSPVSLLPASGVTSAAVIGKKQPVVAIRKLTLK